MSDAEVSILDKIESSFCEFTRQERKIALRVTQKPKQVEQMGIAELANIAGVSNATVTRFVRKVGCKDFTQFKLSLASTSARQTDVPSKNPILDSVSTMYARVLASTWDGLDIDELKHIVEMIKHSERIYVFGMGSSGYTASEFVQRMIRMGIVAFAVTDAHMMYINASIMSSSDLLIVLSNSGFTDDVNEAATVSKQAGTRVVAITSGFKSKLVDIADFPVLVKDIHFINNAGFVNSQFAVMFVLDVITTLLMKEPKYNLNMNRTIQMIMERKYHQ